MVDPLGLPSSGVEFRICHFFNQPNELLTKQRLSRLESVTYPEN